MAIYGTDSLHAYSAYSEAHGKLQGWGGTLGARGSLSFAASLRLEPIEEKLREALRYDAEFPLPYLDLYLVYAQQGYHDRAREFHNRGVKHTEGNSELARLYFGLLEAYWVKEDYPFTVNIARQLISQSIETSEIYCLFGRAHDRLQSADESVPAFQRAAELDPQYVTAWNLLAYKYFRTRDQITYPFGVAV